MNARQKWRGPLPLTFAPSMMTNNGGFCNTSR